MTRSHPLSNRQRKAQRKAVPKAARVQPALTVVSDVKPEPKGLAVREGIRARLAGRLMDQHGADLAVAVALGNMTAKQAMAVLTVDDVSGDDYERTDIVRGRRVVAGNSAIRVPGDDGLAALLASGSLSTLQVKAGLAFRLCYETAAKGLGSGLGNAGEGRVARDWSELSVGYDQEGKLVALRGALELQRAYVLVRLNHMERAVGDVLLDGRELHALRMIAGEGRSVRETAGSGGRAAVAYRDALARSLDAIVVALRITEQ